MYIKNGRYIKKDPMAEWWKQMRGRYMQSCKSIHIISSPRRSGKSLFYNYLELCEEHYEARIQKKITKK